MTTPTQLHHAWHDLLRPFAVPPDVCERVFADLAGRYTSPQRHYHTLDHIAAMLRLLPEASAALALAVWFHDAVYDTRAADNEERSADCAEEMLQALYVPSELRAETRRLVLLTKRHETANDDKDGRLLLDADLAILGEAGQVRSLCQRHSTRVRMGSRGGLSAWSAAHAGEFPPAEVDLFHRCHARTARAKSASESAP